MEKLKDILEERQKLIDQLKYIMDEGSKNDPLINMKYALYIYVRALYVFRLFELTEKVWSELQNIEVKFGKKIHKKEWALTGHPSEIIFKYMRLIALSRDEKDLELKYAKKCRLSYLSWGYRDVVCKFGEIEVMNKMGNIERRDILSLELCGLNIAENYCAFADLVVSEDGEARFKWLEEKITFMYR